MLDAFLLTPAAISYLTQFLLSLVINMFIIQRVVYHRQVQLVLLVGPSVL
jgi:hypothetical protein